MRKRKGRNRRRKVKQYRRSTLILLLTIMYAVVFVAPIFIEQFSAVKVSKEVLVRQASQDAVTALVQVFFLLFGLTVLRLLWFVLWPLLCLASALSNYMVSTFHSQISKDSVAVILESNHREIANFINFDLMIALVSGLTLAIFGLLIFKREKKESRNFRISAVLIVLVVGLITINDGSMSTRFPPYNILTAFSQYAFERTTIMAMDRKNISENASQIRMVGNKPLTIVMVIGESARGDHFSINGYERETTPLLQQRKNLVNFANTASCGVWTRISVPCIFTRATEADKSPIYSETSLISVYKSLGFKTIWIGAQNAIDHPLIDIIHESDSFNLLEGREFLDNAIKDGVLLPLFDKALEEQNGPTLIVLHTFGSHWQYSSRYTEEFEKFKPTCGMTLSRKYDTNSQIEEIKDCSTNKEALVNSYDNSILYTDYILDQVIKRLEDKNALFMYTSDHGESLGENGRFLHGYESAPENHKVAMFWWASNDFITNHQNPWHALVKKSVDYSSHDVIFHSILDCAGVTSSLIDPSLSLCHNDNSEAKQEPQAATEPATATSPADATAPAQVKEEKPKEGPTEDKTTKEKEKAPAKEEEEQEPVEEEEANNNDKGLENAPIKAVDSYLRRSLEKQARRQQNTYAMDERLLLELMK